MSTRGSFLPRLGLALLVLAALTAAGLSWQRGHRLASRVRELEAEQSRVKEQARRSAGAEERLRANAEEIERLRRLTEEVPRLRAQAQEWRQMTQQNAQLQLELSQLRAQPVPGAAAFPAAWIGVALQPLPNGGVAIQSVVPGGPAGESGLAAGDVISAIDGRPVVTVQQVRDAVGGHSPGQTVTVDASRNGTAFRVVVVAGAFPR